MRTLVLAVVLTLSGCTHSLQSGGGVDGVTLRAAPGAARDSIVLTLTNGSAAPVGYNLCSSAVERLAGETWENVPTDRVCTMELRTLEPGAEASFTTTLPPGSTSGDFRFVARVEMPVGGEQRTVPSNVVRVTP